MNKISLLVFLFFVQMSFAIKYVAVLEIVPENNVMEEITVQESRHLTDELRRQAVINLPAKEFSVLTRDNLIALMPPDEEEADCLAESCAVDIGRAIGAEYITQGRLGKFGKRFSISVELFESMGGKLLSSIVFESENADGLLKVIREQSKPLFEKIPIEPLSESLVLNPDSPLSEPRFSGLKDSPDEKKIETNINTEQVGEKGFGAGFWTAVALDVIGAGLIAYGVVKNSEIGDLQKDYDALNESSPQEDFTDKRNKMDDAKSIRNIMYISGGISLAAGIGVHIWF